MQDTSKELLQAIRNDDVSAVRKLLRGAPIENLNAIDKVVSINQYMCAECMHMHVHVQILYSRHDAILHDFWLYIASACTCTCMIHVDAV